MANKIQFRRGNQADLPTLDAGEPAWTTDTERFYIGNPLGSGNILISAGAGGVVGKVGTPVAGQVAFWSNANDITGATGFVWNDTLKKLGIDNVELPVSGRVYLGPSTNATYVAADAAAQVSMTVASQVVMRWFDTSVTLHKRMTGFGAPLPLGALATTTHGLGVNDVLIGGAVEVDGIAYLDGGAVCETVTGSTPSAKLTLSAATGAQLSYGTTDWRVTASYIETDSGIPIGWSSSTRIVDQGDAQLVLSNNTQTDFGLLKLGGITASFPAIKRSGGEIAVRLADDSAYANIIAQDVIANTSLRFVASTRLTAPANGRLLLTDSLGSDFNMLQLGGVTASYPALLRMGVELGVKLADNSDFANVLAHNLYGYGIVEGASPTSSFRIRSRVMIYAPAIGNLMLTDWAMTDFGLLQFGGSSASYPALKRFSQFLHVKLADDSAYTSLVAGSLFANTPNVLGWISRSLMYSPADGDILLTNSTATDFGLLQFGGSTASFPALKRSTNTLQVKLADDSGYATLLAGVLQSAGNIIANSTSNFQWSGRTRIYASADGNVRMSDSTETTFGMLQFGGTTNAFPAWKRNATSLEARLADDSAYASVWALTFYAGANVFLGQSLSIASRIYLQSPAPDNLLLTNVGFTDFGLLQFGGTTSSYPAWRRNATGIDARLADDSGYTTVTALSLQATSNVYAGSYYWFASTVRIYGPTATNILLTNAAATDFGMLQFGGTTSSYPALRKNADGLSLVRADDTGWLNFRAGVLVAADSVGLGGVLKWGDTKSRIYSPVDGNLRLTNAAETDFGLLQFGGTTNAYPALKRSSADLQVRLADDSAYATVTAQSFLASMGCRAGQTGTLSWANRSVMYSDADGNIRLTNSTATDFGLLQFGGTTASYPAWKRNANDLEARLADDSARTTVYVDGLIASGNVLVGAANYVSWPGRSRISSPSNGLIELRDDAGTSYSSLSCAQINTTSHVIVGADYHFAFSSRSRIASSADGVVTLLNWAQTDFSMLQFGGTTVAFPALKRSTDTLEVKLADDSAYATLQAGGLLSTGDVTISATGLLAWSGRARMRGVSTNQILMTNATETSFTSLHFGGMTAAFPAIKRNLTSLEARLSDDSDYTDLNVRSLTALSTVWLGANIRMSAATDGVLTIDDGNSPTTGWTMLQFGGTTSSYPALKRIATSSLEVRAADDSVSTSIYAADHVGTASSSAFRWANKSRIYCHADADITLTDYNSTDFGLLKFGGVTNAYPALKRVGNGLAVRLADDTADAPFICNTIYPSNIFLAAGGGITWGNIRSKIFSPADGNILITNQAGTDFGLLQFGGTTNAYPAWKRSGAALEARLADDSTRCNVNANTFVATSNVQVGASSYFAWASRSLLQSSADGRVLLTNNAGTDFDMLQFGGTTAAFPALKRNGSQLLLVGADGVNPNDFSVGSVFLSGNRYLGWLTRSRLYSSVDGNINLTNDAATDFGLLQFGGVTNAYPALKRTGFQLDVRFADDSGYTALGVGALVCQASNGIGWSGQAYMFGVGAGYIRLTNASPYDDFTMLQFGGATSAYPALKRNGAQLDVRLADDSGPAQLGVGSLIAGAGGFVGWSSRSYIYAPNVGYVRLTNVTVDDFTMLQFGGGTSAYPALKRSGTALHARLADDTNYANFSANGIFAAGYYQTGASGFYYFNSRSVMYSPADGNIMFTDSATTSFNMLQFGGTTSSYPALKRNGTQIEARLADDSGNASFSAANIYIGQTNLLAWSARSRMASSIDGNITLYNLAQADFGLLQFGGTTSGYPALKRSGTQIHARLADDSDYAGFSAHNVYAADYLLTNSGGYLTFGSRCSIRSSADGNVLLTDSTDADFALLQFGGTTSGYPAIKRVGVNLEARRADDVEMTGFSAKSLLTASYLAMNEQASSPSDAANVGKLFVKSSDSKLYYRDDGGTEYDLISSSGVTGSGTTNEVAWWSTGTQLTSDPKLAFNSTTGGLLMGICRMIEQASSPSDTGNVGQLFVRASDAHLVYRTDTGSEYDLTLTAGVSGGGATGRPAIWTGSSTLGDDADFTWNSSTNTLGITSAFTLQHDATNAIIKNTTGYTSYGSSQHRFATSAGAAANVYVTNDAYFGFRTSDVSARSIIGSSADGNVIMMDSTFATFNLLQFGGTTSGYPALQRFGANLLVRKADDTDYSNIYALQFRVTPGGALAFTTRCSIYSNVDGTIVLYNSALTDFNLLQFGGTTSGFPALKRSGAGLTLRLADDSGYASFLCSTLYLDQSLTFGANSRIRSLADGNLTITNQALTDFGMLQFGGTTSGYPAWKRNGATFHARLADDSNYANVAVDSLYINTSTGRVYWASRSMMQSLVDGNITLYNQAQSDFGLLQFGGTTNGFPALKRSSTELQVRLADDSGPGNFTASLISGGNLVSTGYVQCGSVIIFAPTSTRVSAPVNGNLLLTNWTGSDFGLLQFGGTTSGFPALKRVSSSLFVRTADDSANAALVAASMQLATLGGLFSWATFSRMGSTVDGNITLYNSTSTDFGLLQFGGTSASFPALKRHPTVPSALMVRLADDSTYASFYCNNLTVGGSAAVGFSGRSVITSGGVDGNLLLTDSSTSTFGLLQFGGTTIGFPALKRNTDFLEVRTADDSAMTSLYAYRFYATAATSFVAPDNGTFTWGVRTRLTAPADGSLTIATQALTSGVMMDVTTVPNNLMINSSIYCSGAVYAQSTTGILRAGQDGYLFWTNRARVYSSADGNVLLTNNAATDFNLLQFGGTTNAFPAIKRNTSYLEVRLADDTAPANLHAGLLVGNSGVTLGSTTSLTWSSRSKMSSDVDGNIRLNNSAGTDFNMLQFGGTTLSFPAWKRSGANFLAYRADDTGFVSVTAGSLIAINNVVAGADYLLSWFGRTRMYSPADGNIRLTNAAETDFGLLQFGGTTSSFPALKRSGSELSVRFADDSNYASFVAAGLTAVSASIINAQNGTFAWTLRSRMWSDSDGSILLTTSTPSNIGEAATDDFSFLKFGGSTSAYPALKRSGIQLHARLADDSNLAQFVAGTIVSYGNIRCAAGNAIDFLTNTRMWSPIDGNLLLTNNAVTDFNMLQFGGTTSAFPALKRNGAKLELKSADDSLWLSLQAGYLAANTGLLIGSSSFNHARLDPSGSDSKGNIRLSNSTTDDFGLLQLGGTSASFPALKRSGHDLAARLADDSDYTAMIAYSFVTGGGSIYMGTGSALSWASRSTIFSDANGNIRLTDAAYTSFSLLQFGGVTSAFPAIGRHATDTDALTTRLADNSAGCALYTEALISNTHVVAGAAYQFYWATRSRIGSPADGDITLSNSTSDGFGMLRFGGVTLGYPALKRSSNTLEVRLADDSDYAGFTAGGLTSSGNVQAAGAGFFRWSARSKMYSPADGNIMMNDAAGTTFGLLQFGGTTSSYPALKRFLTALQVRLADDTGYGSMYALAYSISGRSILASAVDGNIALTDSAGTTFGLLQFGGTTSSYPALKRSAATLQVKTADDAGYATFQTGTIIINTSDALVWYNRSGLSSPLDGRILLRDSAATGFDMLLFGGITLGYPALKRVSDELQVRLADDSDFADFQVQNLTVNGTLTVSTIGSTNVIAATSGYVGWDLRSRMYSPADGYVQLTDSSGTQFSMLQFGGATSAYPALKRNTTGLQLRLADDSAYAFLQAGNVYVTGSFQAVYYYEWAAKSRMASPADGTITLSNYAVTDFNMLQFGGTGAAFPALKRSGTGLLARLADDTDYASITASNVYSTADVHAGAGGEIGWTARSVMHSVADSKILLTNSVESDFNMLQFGGTGATFPALKRSGAGLLVMRADDSNYADLTALSLVSASNVLANTTTGTYRVGQDGYVYWNNRSRIYSDANGNLRLTDADGTSFGMLLFGGTTASYPALKRSGTGLLVRLADDTAYTSITASSVYSGADVQAGSTGVIEWSAKTRLSTPLDGQLLLTNQTGTSFDRIFVGGQTASFPAIVRNGADVELRLADDAARTGLLVGDIAQNVTTHRIHNTAGPLRLGTGAATSHSLVAGDVMLGGKLEVDGDCFFDSDVDIAGVLTVGGIGFTDVEAGATGYVGWSGRSRMHSPVDGSILLTNNTESDFSVLQFGGTTGAYPCLKRAGAFLQVMSANETAYTGLTTGTVACTSSLKIGEVAVTPGDITNYGTLYVRQSDNALIYRKDTGTEYDLTQTAGVTGGGTLNKLAIWTGASDLGDSGLYWDNTNKILQFGGTTFGYPGLQYSIGGGTPVLICRNAGDTGYISLSASSFYVAGVGKIWFSGGTKSTISSPTTDGNILMTNAAGTSFGLLQFGGETSSFPAIKRNGVQLDFRLADDSNYVAIQAGAFVGQSYVRAAYFSPFYWGGTETRSKMYSPADGDILLTNAAETGFGMLQLGGTTASFAALKGGSADLSIRLADDSAYANVRAQSAILSSLLSVTGIIKWGDTKSRLYSVTDGNIRLTNAAETDFGLLQFGGTTSSFPALKRNASRLDVRNADDTAYAGLMGLELMATSGILLGTSSLNHARLTPTGSDSRGNLLLSNSTSTDFGMLQFGGTTASFPAWKRSGTTLQARLADDTNYADVATNTCYAAVYYTTSAAGQYLFSGRTHILSPSDGNLLLTDNAGTSFGMLQFGGTTSSFPALQRGLSTLLCRTADGLGMASFFAGNIVAHTTSEFLWNNRSRMSSPADGQVRITDNTGTYNAQITVGEFYSEGSVLTVSDVDQYGAFFRRTLDDPTAEVGTQTFTLVKGDLSVTDDTGWDFVYLMDLQVDGVSKFKVWENGVCYCSGLQAIGASVVTGNSDALGWYSRSRMWCDADGNVRLNNYAGTDFGLLQFGGTTSSFPALKRLATELAVRAADDSAYYNIIAATVKASSELRWVAKSRMSSATDGNITLTNDAGTDFGLLQLGGTTASYPALKRIGSAVHILTADGAQYTGVVTGSVNLGTWLNAGSYVTLGTYLGIASRIQISSPATDNLLITNNTSTSFNLLQLGLTNNTAPALKATIGATPALAVRKADDSGYATFSAGAITGVGGAVESTVSLGIQSKSHIYSSVDGALQLRDSANSYNSAVTLGELYAEGLPLTVSDTDQWGAFIRRTLNDPTAAAGTQTFTLLKADLSITDDTGWDNVNVLDLQVDGVSKVRVNEVGELYAVNVYPTNNVQVGGAGTYAWSGRSRMYSDADGNIRLNDSTGATFGLLQFGGTTASFPAWKRSGATFEARAADDSARVTVAAAAFQANSTGSLAFSGRSYLTSPADGNILLNNNAGTSFGLLQFGGTTNAFPALKRNGVNLEVRFADDSALCGISANSFSAVASISPGAAGFVDFGGTRSRISSPVNGNLLVANQATTDFGLFQFGGTTSSFPALKRVSEKLACRLADDSANTALIGTAFYFDGVTSSYPALRYSGTTVLVRLGDDSGDASITADTVTGTGAVVAQRTYTSAGSLDAPFRSQITLNDPTGPNTGNNFAAIYADVTLTATAGWENVYMVDIRANGFRKLTVGTAGELTTEAFIRLREQGSSPSDVANYGTLFTRSSDNALIYRTDGGTEYDLTQTAGVSGGGTAGRIAVWTGASDLGDDADFTWNTSTNALALGGITLETAQGGIKQTVPTITSAGADDYALSVNQTLSDATVDTGTQVYSLIKGALSITDDTGWDEVYVLNLQVDGSSVFKVTQTGNATLSNTLAAAKYYANATQSYNWSTRSSIYSDADGNIRLNNSAGTDFGLLQFGGTTSAFPALKRNSVQLQVRLADDSGYAALYALSVSTTGSVIAGTNFTWSGTTSLINSATDGNINISNNAGTGFGLLTFGGTTSSYPAIKRSTTAFHIKLADDSAFTGMQLEYTLANAYHQVGDAGRFQWATRSKIYSDVNGNLRLTDTAGTDFGLLQFGGTTSSFPALKRSTTSLQVRLADDTGYGGLVAANFQIASPGSLLSWGGASRITSFVDGNITLYDLAQTSFGLLQFGGISASYPAIGRHPSDTDALICRLADSSDMCKVHAASFVSASTVVPAASSYIDFGGTRSRISSPADGNVLLTNQAATDFGLLQFGGTTSSFPALKRSTTTLQARLADDSGWANLDAYRLWASGYVETAAAGFLTWTGRSRLYSDSDGNIRLTDTAGADFGLLQFGGTSASFPAWKRSGATLECKLADDSGYATLVCHSIGATTGSVSTSSAGVFAWTGRSRMYSDADGDIRLTNAAGTSFDMLVFGATTASFAALRGINSVIEARLGDDTGRAYVHAAGLQTSAGGGVNFNTRSWITSPADGNVLFLNNAQTDFGLLQFGGTSASFPAIKRVGAGLRFRLADDSGDAGLVAKSIQSTSTITVSSTIAFLSSSTLKSSADGYIELSNDAGTGFTALRLGGTTASFPMLKVNGATLEAKLADDSAYATVRADNFYAGTGVRTEAAGLHYWSGRSVMKSSADGYIELTNTAGTDFGALRFGGTTASFPMLRRSGTYLQMRLADDSAFTSFEASTFVAQVGGIQIQGGAAVTWASRSLLVSPSSGVVDVQNISAGLGAIRTGRVVEANTAGSASPNALAAAEAYTVFTNEAATEKNYQALPPAAAGIQYTFVVQDSDGIRIVAQTGDTIRIAGSVSSSGGYVESTTVGDCITIVAVNSTEWFAIQLVGSGWSAA